MRSLIRWTLIGALGLMFAGSAANAGNGIHVCDVCTCTDGAIICIDTNSSEILEEQGICGGACAGIGSSFESRERVESACSELPACDHAEAPAASPLWLSLGALALVTLGGLGVRRRRQPSAP